MRRYTAQEWEQQIKMMETKEAQTSFDTDPVANVETSMVQVISLRTLAISFRVTIASVLALYQQISMDIKRLLSYSI